MKRNVWVPLIWGSISSHFDSPVVVLLPKNMGQGTDSQNGLKLSLLLHRAGNRPTK